MAQLIVTNLNDAGAGSLRQAVLDANASVGVADTIVFSGAVAGGTLTLTSGGLSLSDDVTIDGDTNGDHKADITISGNNTSQILAVGGSQTDAVLKSLTLTNGKAFVGGAIYLSGGPFSFPSLTISDTTISNCSANIGGAIYSKSNVTISNSLITNNTSNGPTGGGGGIYMKGGGLTLSNSTLDGNNALLGNGGGIALTNYSNLNLVNSTVTNNNAQAGTAATDGGGGISVNFNSTVNITNSVITQNTSSDKLTVNDVSGVVQVADHSVFSSAVAISNNIFSLTNVADVGLGTLGNHGGTTQTRDILSGSVLINAGSNAAAAGISTDANGNVRVQGGTVDIGATEYRLIEVTNLNDTGAGSLRDALTLAQARVGEDHIVFQSGLSGTILTASTLSLTTDVTINGDTNGDGDPDIFIGSTAAHHLGVQVNGGVTASLTSLGISGFTTQTGASAIVNLGNLTLSYDVISSNTVTGGGTQQGLSAQTVLNGGTLNISQTVFASNSQTGQAGLAAGYVFGTGLPGGVGGSASSILNNGTLSTAAVAFSGITSQGGKGGAGGNANGYSYADGGNGGKGGASVGGILNFGQISNSFGYMGMIGTNTIISGQGGAGGYATYGGTPGVGGAPGATSPDNLNQGTGSGSPWMPSRLVLGDQLANSLNGFITFATYGLTGNDSLYGGSGGERLFGGTGNDTLTASINFNSSSNGGLGNDLLRITNLSSFNGTSSSWAGGSGIDTLDVSSNASIFNVGGLTINLLTGVNNISASISGIENLIGTSAANDTLTGNGVANRIQGLGGFDILDGGVGSDTLDYSEKTGNIALTLNGATTVFQQLNGVNEDVISNFENIIGGSGVDVLTGDITDNTFRGGLGGDTLNGGGNTAAGDTLSYEGSALGVKINLALNTAADGDAAGDFISNFENVSGSSQDDQLTGSTGVNKLLGGAGNDLLNGGLGADVLDGGSGTSDTADYRASTGTNIAVNLLLDTASGGHAAGDTLDNIENLFGSFTQRDILIGNTGNNILKGFGGVDSLVGGDGDDFMEGGVDADAINGGAGIDTASYRDSNVGQVSINLLTATHSGGDAQGDTLFFIENLEGSLTRRDILIGNIVANRIIGNGGVDTIQGGDGNDFIDGGTGGDSLNAGAGIDTLSYEKSSAGVTVDLNVALQTSAGDANGDSLFFFENVNGSDFGDNIKGNLVSNRLVGGLGADTLNGGTGSDYLTGGVDADTFRFTDTAFGSDTILDWQDGSDKISMALTIADAFSDFTITGNGTAHAVIKIIGVPGSAITVNAAAPFTLDAGDFVFV